MKKTIKNLALILMLVVAFTFVSMQASAADASALTFADCDGGVMVTACTKNASGEITIPAEYQGKKVVAIADNAFANCTGLTKVVMPDSIITVGECAFEGCTAIAEVTLSYNLKTIESYAFFACDALKSVTIYPEIKEIGSYAFFDCDSLTSVVIPEGFVNIPDGAFGDCVKLDTIFLPMTVKTVGDNAFVNCSAIKTVYFIGSPIAWEGIKWGSGNELMTRVVYTNFNHLHDYTKTVIVAPDCTNYGTNLNVCACGYTYRDNTVAPLGHKAEKIAEIKATCEETGKTAGEKCSVCGVILTTPQTIPATGHNPVNDAAVEATCTATGLTLGSHCNTCGHVFVKQETVPMKGHEFDYKNLTPATLTANGVRVGTCKLCGYESNETLYSVTVIKLAKTSYDYNGKARKPGVTVQDSEGNTLIVDRDYTVKYASGRKNPGVYNVTITLKGEYEGSKTLSFQIIPSKAESLKAKASKKTEAKITWNEVPGATGYRIYIFKSADSTTKKKIDPATSNSYVLKKDYNGKALVMGKTYKISVTPYVKTANGEYIFAKEATIIKFKFAPATPTLTVASNAKGKATVEWTNVAAETGYKLYISEDGGKTFKLYKTYKGWPDKQTLTGLKAGAKYSFKIRAYTTVDSKTTVYSSYSAVKTVTIKK